MTHSIRFPFFLLLILLLTPVSHAVPFPKPTLPRDGTELGKHFRKFAALKQAEIQQVAEAKGTDLPAQVDAFFAAIRSNQWSRAEAVYMAFKHSARRQGDNDASALSTGMHDVSGVYDLTDDWNSQLMKLYVDEALRAVPDGSIVFGGTSEGRFFITYGAQVQQKGKVTVVTQNALADNTYVDYLRHAVGKRISVFPVEDSASAFQEYVEDVKAGRRDSKGSMSIEGGRVKITGVHAVMDINGILARRLVEMNQDAHDFYVEESYIIDWMYEYLTPHGLIMKLNKRPIETLPMATVKADKKYWQDLESKLNSIPDFSQTDAARKAFSKCRCAIAGLYAHHDMKTEAEAAFRQALRLCPSSPEANFRFADLLKKSGEYGEAGAVLTEYMKSDPSSEQTTRVTEYLKKLRKLKDGEQDESTVPSEAAPSASPDVR